MNGIHKKQLAVLREDPRKMVGVLEIPYRDSRKYTAMRMARREATKINLGLSDLSEVFPSSEFGAVYMDEKDRSRCVVMVCVRSHVPTEWKKFVEGE